mgnify:CR=1 FL=1
MAGSAATTKASLGGRSWRQLGAGTIQPGRYRKRFASGRMISSPTVRELSFFPFNELHSVIKMSPPLISRPAAASFPPGEAGGWLRRVSPFNVPGLLSNLGRASVASPTVVGNFGWHHSTGRVKMLLFLPRERTGRVRAVAGLVKIQRASLKTFRFPPRKRHRAG